MTPAISSDVRLAPNAVTIGNIRLTTEKLATILGSAPRWRILIALAHVEWLPAQFLAGTARVSRTAVSQHLRMLRESHIVEQGFGRLYRLRDAWRSRLAEGWIEFHLARMRYRLDPPQPAAPAAPATPPAAPAV